MLLSLRLVKVDIGFRVVHLNELVTHNCVAVVLIACEPGTIRLAPMVPLGGALPTALTGVNADDFLHLQEGDMTGKLRQWL